MLAVAYAPSYAVGERMLRMIGDIDLSGRGLNKTAVKIGSEMVAERAARVEAYFAQPLPRRHTAPKRPIELACVSADGGRMQTRDEGAGKGVHRPHWRENKNALFLRMKSRDFVGDPHPDLPACFAHREQVKKLLSGVREGTPPAGAVEDAASSLECDPAHVAKDWRPEPLFRTCLSSLADSEAFGRMMEAEADARGFYHAAKKAFVADGLPYNWAIQRRHFRDFTPILDFVHAVEHLYDAASCIDDGAERRWQDYLRWARACWNGNVSQVIAELRAQQQRVGLPPPDCEKTDARKVLADTVGYLQNNAVHMKYPAYRQQGLPTTSAHMESFVKEINARVKGTEKFWNDGASGEAILQIRAAALCEDDRLSNFLRSRPGHPFHPNVPRRPSLTTAS